MCLLLGSWASELVFSLDLLFLSWVQARLLAVPTRSYWEKLLAGRRGDTQQGWGMLSWRALKSRGFLHLWVSKSNPDVTLRMLNFWSCLKYTFGEWRTGSLLVNSSLPFPIKTSFYGKVEGLGEDVLLLCGSGMGNKGWGGRTSRRQGGPHSGSGYFVSVTLFLNSSVRCSKGLKGAFWAFHKSHCRHTMCEEALPK